MQVYAPTTDAEEAKTDQFYEDLQHLVELTLNIYIYIYICVCVCVYICVYIYVYILFIIGDLNAKVEVKRYLE